MAGLRKIMQPKEHWLHYFLQTAVGDDIEIDMWLQTLVEMGYVRNSMVTSPGEFALRGGI
ncbi:Transcription-repair-coupling factor [compost metagenome]